MKKELKIIVTTCSAGAEGFNFGPTDAAPRALTALPAEEVHVWRVPVELFDWKLSGLIDLLSWDERMRADRFKCIPDRAAFVTCRGALRLILSRYTGEDPRAISITYGQYGKPQIGRGAAPLRFSVSHSREAGVVAVTRGREVGVDVERIRSIPNVMELAERCFSQRETAQLKKLPEHLRLEGFYHCWTRKEAFAKALGKGLSLPLDQFSVSVVPEAAELVHVLWDTKEVMRWRLHDLPGFQSLSKEKYVGAIAVEGRNWRLRCRQFEVYRDDRTAADSVMPIRIRHTGLTQHDMATSRKL